MASISKGTRSKSPHDRFFRSYFQRPDILQALAEFVLPSDLYCELDFTRFSLDTDTHVERKQSTRYSDLSATVGYRGGGNAVPPGAAGGAGRDRGGATGAGKGLSSDRPAEAKLYLLFEHKSLSDSWVTLQLLRYMTRIWSRHERESHTLPLPPGDPDRHLPRSLRPRPYRLRFALRRSASAESTPPLPGLSRGDAEPHRAGSLSDIWAELNIE